MLIHGFQKLTLLDFPGKVACTIFIAGCNFRCPYCHNSELIGTKIDPVTDSAEFLRFLEKRKGTLDGVAITGGEPLLNPELPALIKDIRSLGYPVKLDTNGSLPGRLAPLLSDGLLDYVAMDIKNSPEKYAAAIGLPADRFDLSPVCESVRLLMSSGVDYEFRTTVVKQFHDGSSFPAIGEWIKGAKKYYLQPFTDRDTVVFSGLSAPEDAEIEKYAEIMRQYVDFVGVRGK